MAGGSKQLELEYLATEKGVVSLIEVIKSLPDESENIISTLRIFNLDKVGSINLAKQKNVLLTVNSLFK